MFSNYDSWKTTEPKPVYEPHCGPTDEHDRCLQCGALPDQPCKGRPSLPAGA